MAETKTRKTTTSRTRKPASAARKTPATKSTPTARRQAAQTKRSTSSKRGQATRANARTQARARQIARGPRSRVEQAQELAERAVLVQVGAALEARDRVVSTVSGVVDTYTSRTNARRQLKRFERRGATARTRLENEVKQTRTRLDRTVRRNEQRLERDLHETRRHLQRDGKGLRRNVGANVDLVTAQVENAVQSGLTAGAKLASAATERVVA